MGSLPEVNPKGATYRVRKRKKVKVGTLIQTLKNGQWSDYSLKVTKVINQYQFFARAKHHPETSFKNNDLDVIWRKYTPYKVGEASEKIKDGSEWPDYKDARQTLNYRKHKQFSNPPGKDWHHIIEQSNEGKHSVKNLAIVNENLNRGFLNQFFYTEYPGTGEPGVNLRNWLRGQ